MHAVAQCGDLIITPLERNQPIELVLVFQHLPLDPFLLFHNFLDSQLVLIFLLLMLGVDVSNLLFKSLLSFLQSLLQFIDDPVSAPCFLLGVGLSVLQNAVDQHQ